jgi:Fe-S cluster assembly protein SufD
VVRAGRGSTARILLSHLGDDTERWVNSVVDVEVGPDATVHLYRLVEAGTRGFHIERIEATVAQRGRFIAHDAPLGAGLARLDLFARLAAPHAMAELTGLFLADGTSHLDTHVRVDHLAVATRSMQDYRGVAAGRGRAIFNGKAVVHQGAQQSEARQTSRNLLLTPGAEIDTKPELEIYADDVQCSHGATTGQLDPAALFYLRSRGLTETEARAALTRAFAGAVLARIDHPAFAARVHEQLETRLARLLEVPR